MRRIAAKYIYILHCVRSKTILKLSAYNCFIVRGVKMEKHQALSRLEGVDENGKPTDGS